MNDVDLPFKYVMWCLKLTLEKTNPRLLPIWGCTPGELFPQEKALMNDVDMPFKCVKFCLKLTLEKTNPGLLPISGCTPGELFP